MLQRLRDKAISVYSQFSGHNITPPPTADKAAESELEIFAGYTRVVAKKVLQHGIHRAETPPQTESRFSSPPLRWNDGLEDMQRAFDPSIVQYFNDATPFADVPPLAEPQASAFDAGLFFAFPPSAMADVYAGSAYEQPPQIQDQMLEWPEYLRAI
ncbi:hypothetical protein C8F04DRAFT_1118945 [Mycena alexandri]|uniref:Uncharacterized protein n=1 Tax=Mycena alexandri TaxID=1745969 RepID=A0AAD6SJE4_9AGAR|nr:hypothetical protein C8F04DRAFT_1118945 [Mycena alexandri]